MKTITTIFENLHFFCVYEWEHPEPVWFATVESLEAFQKAIDNLKSDANRWYERTLADLENYCDCKMIHGDVADNF